MNRLLSLEAVMILNHKAAIEFLLESTAEAGFDRRTILNPTRSSLPTSCATPPRKENPEDGSRRHRQVR
jgi:hypothetical protein